MIDEILKEYKNNKLDFVKGILVASGEKNVDNYLRRIDESVEKIKTELTEINPLDVRRHLDTDNTRPYKHLFAKVPIPSGGDCLLQTIMQNVFLSRLGFDCSVIRFVTQNRSKHVDDKISYHVESCVGRSTEPGSYSDPGWPYWVCSEQEYSNHALIAYTFFQRGSNAGNFDKNEELVKDFYEKALLFEDKDFIIWQGLSESYRKLGDSDKAEKYLKKAEELKPTLKLMTKDDKQDLMLL